MSRVSGRYSIDLAGLHASCESNYARLLQLFPDYEVTNLREFQLSGGARVRIEVVGRCRYTTLMRARQQGNDHDWLAPPRFELRVYHDVRMVEVTGLRAGQPVAARYEYPNPAMHARDEKVQQNKFLAEWLEHCLRQGHCNLELAQITGAT